MVRDDGDKMIGKGGQVDDDDDDKRYHDYGKDSKSYSEHSEVVVDADQDLDDDEDSVTSGQQQRENELQRRDGDRQEVLTSTGNTARAIQNRCRNTNRC